MRGQLRKATVERKIGVRGSTGFREMMADGGGVCRDGAARGMGVMRSRPKS